MMPLSRSKASISIMVIALALVGCTGSSMDDLRAQVDEIKAQKAPPIPPLPEFRPAEGFVYSAADLDHPFTSWMDKIARIQAEQSMQQEKDGLRPDLERRRESLESFPLDTLRMVGTLTRESVVVALVSSPDGLVSRIQPGNYLGQNHGKVVDVLGDKIEIMEIVADGLGGWQYRPTSIALVEQDKK